MDWQRYILLTSILIGFLFGCTSKLKPSVGSPAEVVPALFLDMFLTDLTTIAGEKEITEALTDNVKSKVSLSADALTNGQRSSAVEMATYLTRKTITEYSNEENATSALQNGGIDSLLVQIEVTVAALVRAVVADDTVDAIEQKGEAITVCARVALDTAISLLPEINPDAIKAIVAAIAQGMLETAQPPEGFSSEIVSEITQNVTSATAAAEKEGAAASGALASAISKIVASTPKDKRPTAIAAVVEGLLSTVAADASKADLSEEDTIAALKAAIDQLLGSLAASDLSEADRVDVTALIVAALGNKIASLFPELSDKTTSLAGYTNAKAEELISGYVAEEQTSGTVDDGSGSGSGEGSGSSDGGSGSVATDVPPVANPITIADMLEDINRTITLVYTDTNGDLAATCNVTDLQNIVVETPCSCADGVCTVTIRGLPNYVGAASFKYSVVANTVASNTATASLTLGPDDPPAPTALSFADDVYDADYVVAPKIVVAGVTTGNTVKVYSDSLCTAEIASITAPGVTATVQLPTLSPGVHAFYATQETATDISVCSSAHQDYTLGTISVAPMYPNGPTTTHLAWNYYVDATTTTAACDPSTATRCLHAGSIRKVSLDLYSSCSGVAAADSEGVFKWMCKMIGGVPTFVSADFQDGKGLADVIDAGDFLELSVGVTRSTLNFSTGSSTWWIDDVVELATTSAASLDLTASDTVYILSTAGTTNGYRITADRASFVVEDGADLRWEDGSVANCHSTYRCIVFSDRALDTRRNFVWIEGEFNTDGATTDAHYGISLEYNHFTRLHNVKVLNNNDTSFSIYLGYGKLNLITHALLYKGQHGIRLFGSDRTRIFDIRTNDTFYDPVYSGNATNTNLQFLTASNGYGGTGVGTNSIVTGVLVLNSNYGITADTRSIMQMSSAISTAPYGATLKQYSTSSQIVSVNASQGGVMLSSLTYDPIWIHDVTSTENGFYNIYSNAYPTGFEFKGIVQAGIPGLIGVCDMNSPGNVSNDGSHNCVETDDELDLTAGHSASSSFVGAVADEPANAHSMLIQSGNGVVAFASITDWLNFSSRFRAFGKGENSSMIASQNRDACTANDCTLWDASLKETDTLLRDRFPCPSAEVFLSHTFSDASTATFLKYAYERWGDLEGDDDGLCESDETCVYSPNFGAYQGHGNLVPSSTTASACADLDGSGTVKNVRLLEFESNGY